MNTTSTVEYSTSTPVPDLHLPITPVLLFVFGSAGNFVAMIALIRSSKTHKWRSFYRFVCALVMSDFIGNFGPSCISMMVYLNQKQWIGGQAVCDFGSFCIMFAGLLSAYIVGTMSLDRYLAVRCPHFYNTHVTKQRINTTLIVLSILALFITCLPLVGVNENIQQYPGTWCFFNFRAMAPKDKFYSYFYVCLGTAVMVFMITLNTMAMIIYGKRCKNNKRRLSFQGKACKRSRQSLNDIYNITFLVVLMTAFTICWVPLMVRILINQLNLVERNPETDMFVMRIAFANQIMDPWIYILLRKEFLAIAMDRLKKHTPKCRVNIINQNTNGSITSPRTRTPFFFASDQSRKPVLEFTSF